MRIQELAIETISKAVRQGFISESVRDIKEVEIACNVWARQLYEQIVNIQSMETK